MDDKIFSEILHNILGHIENRVDNKSVQSRDFLAYK